jgi:hypothetical protein
LGRRYCLRSVDGADHEFTRSGARAALAQTLSEELYVPNADSARPQDTLTAKGSGLSPVRVVTPPPKH